MMDTTHEVKLPDRPSALIRLAMRDLDEVEADPHYEIDMMEWHTGILKGDKKFGDLPCRVCLAGAVMAKTLGQDVEVDARPDHSDGFTPEEVAKLFALNYFREGNVTKALDEMPTWIEFEHLAHLNREVVEYADDPEMFHEKMLEIADDLEQEGL